MQSNAHTSVVFLYNKTTENFKISTMDIRKLILLVEFVLFVIVGWLIFSMLFTSPSGTTPKASTERPYV